MKGSPAIPATHMCLLPEPFLGAPDRALACSRKALRRLHEKRAVAQFVLSIPNLSQSSDATTPGGVSLRRIL
jgi:hypothetical protein